MVDEVKKSCINVTEFRIANGATMKRSWTEDKINIDVGISSW